MSGAKRNKYGNKTGIKQLNEFSINIKTPQNKLVDNSTRKTSRFQTEWRETRGNSQGHFLES